MQKKLEKTFSTKNVCFIWFPFRKYILEKMCMKNCNFQSFCYLAYKNSVTEKSTLLKIYLLTVLLSIAVDKLPSLAIRADEAHHRIVNHTLGSMKPADQNPFRPGA